MSIKPIIKLAAETGRLKPSFITKPLKLNPAQFSELRYAPVDSAEFFFVKKILSKEEILNIKPSEFKKLLEGRVDIAPKIREVITTPEKLNLYTELSALEEIKALPLERRTEFFESLLKQWNEPSEVAAQMEMIPKLLKRGYKPEVLAELPITGANKNQIEYLLSRPELADRLGFTARFVNDKNVKYLDECMELTGSAQCLPYWGRETSKIIREFGTEGLPMETLDRIFRRGHNYDSVKKIFGNEQITPLTGRLLEFKNYDKFKNIGIEEFKHLSVTEKKEFLNGFISAITPANAKWPSQCGLSGEGLEVLKSKMKIFKELNPETSETFMTSYYDTIRKMLNEIPASERAVIRTPIDTKVYRRAYREANPIPTLSDDILQILPTREVILQGRKIKVAELDRNADIGIATHVFRGMPDKNILNMEALEITDPRMFICVGQKGGARKLNFDDSRVALIMRPRQGGDLHVQAFSDIDSGNNAMKNTFNFENIMLPAMGNHCSAIDYIPNLLKKELNLSQLEYTARMKPLKGATTLQEIGKIDPEMEAAIRKVLRENRMFEGIMRPETMGVAVSSSVPLEKISPDILSYCERRGIPLVQVK